MDIQARYEFPSPVRGKISLHTNASFTNHFQTRALPTSGLVETAGAGGPIRWRGYGSATWDDNRMSVTVTGRYVGHFSSSTTSVSGAFPTATGYDGGRIPAFLRWDLQASYTFPYVPDSHRVKKWLNGTKFTLGVLNIFNEEPSFVSDGSGFYNRQDDPRQRFVYFQIRKSL
jgi:hypothetical protein